MSDEQAKETKLDQIRREMQEKDKNAPTNSNDKIVHKLAEGISRTVGQPTDTPADLIMEQAQKSKLLIGKGQQQVVAAKSEKKEDLELPRLNSLPPIVINGHEFKRTNVPHLDAVTILMYIVAEVLSDDPRVDSILKQVQFMFPDNSGNQIYPKVRTRKVKKAKKRNVRPTK